uniref:Ovule protein n=1 Tax=Parascaris univalens TaxID=6257 RepID=A0A915AM55_PARUN
MARRELYARIEPKYITTCNMTVKTAVIIFVSVETLLMTTACMCCFWFAYFNLGALCVAILIWLIFILFGAMIGFQWALIPFGVLHCIAVLLLTFAVFSVITITICPYYQERWIDYLEDIAAENSYWLTRNQLYSLYSFLLNFLQLFTITEAALAALAGIYVSSVLRKYF